MTISFELLITLPVSGVNSTVTRIYATASYASISLFVFGLFFFLRSKQVGVKHLQVWEVATEKGV